MKKNNENIEFEPKREFMLQEVNDMVWNEIDNLNKKIYQSLEQIENKLQQIEELKSIKEEKKFLALYNDIKIGLQNIDDSLDEKGKENDTKNFSEKIEDISKNESIESKKTDVFGDNNKLIISEKERKSVSTI